MGEKKNIILWCTILSLSLTVNLLKWPSLQFTGKQQHQKNTTKDTVWQQHYVILCPTLTTTSVCNDAKYNHLNATFIALCECWTSGHCINSSARCLSWRCLKKWKLEQTVESRSICTKLLLLMTVSVDLSLVLVLYSSPEAERKKGHMYSFKAERF